MASLPSSSNKNEDKSPIFRKLLDDFANVPREYIFGLIAATSSAFLVRRQFGKRIKNSDWVTPTHMKKRWIKGVVTSVGDADNFRLYHTPAFGYNWPFRFRKVPTLPKDLKNETIHVRIAGVDAPEGAHFGKPGQLYYPEALEWLRKQILGKYVYCQLLRRDQYGRVVAHVCHPPLLLPGSLFSGKNLAIEMLKAGWAVTYDQAGAEYGQSGKLGYLQRENEAKLARKGMWKDGEVRDSPAAYKRRHAEGSLETGQTTKAASTPGPARSRSNKNKRSWTFWLRRWVR